MDPNACYHRIIVAWRERDYEELKWACLDLARWIEFGGPLPVKLLKPGGVKDRLANEAGLRLGLFVYPQLNRIATRCRRAERRQARP